MFHLRHLVQHFVSLNVCVSCNRVWRPRLSLQRCWYSEDCGFSVWRLGYLYIAWLAAIGGRTLYESA